MFRQLILTMAVGPDTLEAIKKARTTESEGGEALTPRELITIGVEFIGHLQSVSGVDSAVIDLRTIPTRDELKQLLDDNNIKYVD